jgi:hypothetical protein
VFRNAGLTADPWQQDFLASTSPRRLALCARQVGKSTTAAALALWRAIHEPGFLALIVSPAQRQSTLLLERIFVLYRAQPSVVTVRAQSKTHLVFSNESSILSLPASEQGIRGYSPHLLVVDEAARLNDRAFAAISPMLGATSGTFVALTTPGRPTGWFHGLWTSDEDFERTKIGADACPRISKEHLDRERRILPRDEFQREYEAEFCDSQDGKRAIFAGIGDLDSLLDAAFERSTTP